MGTEPEVMLKEIDKAVENGEHEPTDWEIKFLDDIRPKIDSLTEKQIDALDTIWQKIGWDD